MDRFNWILYPEAKQKLEKSGLMRRIDNAVKSNRIGYTGYISDQYVAGNIKDMNKDRLFESIPEEERKKFKKALQDAWANKSKFYWSVKRNGEDSKEDVESGDFLLLSGFRSSEILRKAELFDHKKFGFSSISELTGTTGAAIEIAIRKSVHDNGLKWETARPDGRIITSVMTGDHNADFRIYQNDITAYETIDPLGNKVSYRPEMAADRMIVAAYHSTEAQTLASFLKYIDQTGIKPKALENNAVDIIDWAKSLGQYGGTCAEHFGGFDRPPLQFFVGWSIPIPQLDEKYETKDRCLYNIYTLGGKGYNFYISPQTALVITRHDANEGAVDVKGSVSFLPDEMDNAIKGLLYQSAKGLGRTSVKQLINILEYKFSPDFDKDMKEYSIL